MGLPRIMLVHRNMDWERKSRVGGEEIGFLGGHCDLGRHDGISQMCSPCSVTEGKS